jgi:hypothetical protein
VTRSLLQSVSDLLRARGIPHALIGADDPLAGIGQG